MKAELLVPPERKITILYTPKEIEDRIHVLGGHIREDYRRRGKAPTLLVMLKGAVPFAHDLVREIYDNGKGLDCDIKYLRVGSYNNEDSLETSGTPRIEGEVPTFKEDELVLGIDDILDTGITASFVGAKLAANGLKRENFNWAFLLQKPKEVRRVKVNDDEVKPYVGFDIPNVWVEGYGMDSFGKGRGRKNIVVRWDLMRQFAKEQQ